MFTETFLNEHPLSIAFIKSVFNERIIQAFKSSNVPEDMHEVLLTASLSNERMLEILEGNPNVLFEILDIAGVHFYVFPYKVNGKIVYGYNSMDSTEIDMLHIINSVEEIICDKYPTRVEAEKYAIKKALEELEEKLKTLKELE